MWITGFKCLECGKDFEVRGYSLQDKKRSFSFCSQECYTACRTKSRKGGHVECETCKRVFFVTAARVRQTARNGSSIRFCSMKCYTKTGDKNPFWGQKHKAETVAKFLTNPNRYIFPTGRNNPNYKRWERSPARRSNPNAMRASLRFQIECCEICGWNIECGVLQIHHRDRNREHNERNNVQLLCPNCHEVEHLRAKDGRWKPTKKPRKAPPIVFVEL